MTGLEEFNLLKSGIQFFGFIFLVLGNFTYNEVIEWKCMGINRDMKKYRVEESAEDFADKIISLEGGDEEPEPLFEKKGY